MNPDLAERDTTVWNCEIINTPILIYMEITITFQDALSKLTQGGIQTNMQMRLYGQREEWTGTFMHMQASSLYNRNVAPSVREDSSILEYVIHLRQLMVIFLCQEAHEMWHKIHTLCDVLVLSFF
jgi:hypothetical protein